MIRSWKRVKTGEATDYTIFKIRRDIVVDPRNGNEHERALMEAPDWVNVVPITRDGELLLIRQFRFGVWSPTLEVPGGIIDPGEDAESAAARELEEETGFRPERMVRLGMVHPNPAFQNNRCHLFVAEGCVQVHSGDPDAGEDIELEKVPMARVAELVRRGEITHALVVCALSLYALERRG